MRKSARLLLFLLLTSLVISGCTESEPSSESDYFARFTNGPFSLVSEGIGVIILPGPALVVTHGDADVTLEGNFEFEQYIDPPSLDTRTAWETILTQLLSEQIICECNDQDIAKYVFLAGADVLVYERGSSQDNQEQAPLDSVPMPFDDPSTS